MTDNTAHTSTRPVDAGQRPLVVDSLEQIAAGLQARSLPVDEPVVLLDLDDGGVLILTVDLATRAVLNASAAEDIGPDALDRVIADHLIRIGRVEMPTAPAWDAELLDLVARGRERLRDSDGTFIMGRQHIRLFRLARRDVEESTRDLVARVEVMTRAAVSDCPRPVAAVIAADGLRDWPGLRDSIARAVPVPVVDLDAPEPGATGSSLGIDAQHTPTTNAHVDATDVASVDFPAMVPAPMPVVPEPASPEPVAAALIAPEPVAAELIAAEPVAPEPVAPEPIREAPISGPPVDDTPTEPIPVIATSLAYSDVSAPDSSVAGDAELFDDSGLDDEQPDAVAPDVESTPFHRRDRGLLYRAGGKRVAAVVGTAAVLALVGVATAFALTDDDSAQRTAAAPSSSAPVTQPAPSSYADPAVLAEARLPAQQYTPPPPPPPQTTPNDTTTRPRSRPRPRPRPRLTIPNPIPGLPPIVLP